RTIASSGYGGSEGHSYRTGAARQNRRAACVGLTVVTCRGNAADVQRCTTRVGDSQRFGWAGLFNELNAEVQAGRSNARQRRIQEGRNNIADLIGRDYIQITVAVEVRGRDRFGWTAVEQPGGVIDVVLEGSVPITHENRDAVVSAQRA